MFYSRKFANCLASKRYYNGYSQAEYAALLGVPLSSYIAWERGMRLPSNKNLAAILGYYSYLPSAMDFRKAYTADKMKLRRKKGKTLRGASGK